MDIMAVIQEHGALVFLAICVVVGGIIFRRQTGPIFLGIISFFMYMVPAHFVLFCLVKLSGWFKDASSMKRAFEGDGDYNPGWTLPLLRVWDRTEFTPAWLFHFEVFLALVAVVIVWKYQPLRQYDRKKAITVAKKYPQGYTPHRMTGRK